MLLPEAARDTRLEHFRNNQWRHFSQDSGALGVTLGHWFRNEEGNQPVFHYFSEKLTHRILFKTNVRDSLGVTT